MWLSLLRLWLRFWLGSHDVASIDGGQHIFVELLIQLLHVEADVVVGNHGVKSFLGVVAVHAVGQDDVLPWDGFDSDRRFLRHLAGRRGTRRGIPEHFPPHCEDGWRPDAGPPRDGLDDPDRDHHVLCAE